MDSGQGIGVNASGKVKQAAHERYFWKVKIPQNCTAKGWEPPFGRHNFFARL
jgi:hypothetical protein